MEEQATSERSLTKALVFFLATLVALVLWALPRMAGLPAETQGEIVGRLVFATLLPAIIVGYLSRRGEQAYSWLKFGVLYVLTLLLFLLLQMLGGA